MDDTDAVTGVARPRASDRQANWMGHRFGEGSQT